MHPHSPSFAFLTTKAAKLGCSPTKWKIAFAPGPDNEQLWEFLVSHPAPALRIGGHHLREFIAGLNDVIEGAGDYSIGGHSKEPRGSETPLWFWWQ